MPMMHPELVVSVILLPKRAYDVLQVILDGDSQTGPVARPELSGSRFDIP